MKVRYLGGIRTWGEYIWGNEYEVKVYDPRCTVNLSFKIADEYGREWWEDNRDFVISDPDLTYTEILEE